jgi:hypothetical protein
VAELLVDDVPVAFIPNGGTHTIDNITADHTIEVNFMEAADVSIIASAGPNGTITPAGTTTICYNADQSYMICPNVGYDVYQIYVNNELVELNPDNFIGDCYVYDFTHVIENQTIFVTFTVATHYITVTACEGGAVTPSGVVPVLYNQSITIFFYPEEGYKVSEVLVDGMPYPQAIPEGQYTFFYVTDHHDFYVCFTKITYPITAKINGNGFIVPAGTTQVPHGTDMTYTFWAIDGYEITHVFIDGMTNGPAVATGEHTFEHVTAPHTIDVITALKTYKITATAGQGGFITPSGDISVDHDGTQVFTITPQNGYNIEEVLVDGVPNGEAVMNGSYAFSHVMGDHTISATFSIKKYAYKGIAHEDGMIDPAGETEVTFGEDITYTITPNAGYEINYILVNGQNKGSISTYTFFAVEDDGIVEAFFKQITGIDENELHGISIYSHLNQVYIMNPDHLNITDIAIIDMYGRIVWQGVTYNNPITLDVANGVYTVRLTGTDDTFVTKVPIIR